MTGEQLVVGGVEEVGRVTNVAGEVLTIERTQEGSSGRTAPVGDSFAPGIAVKPFADIPEASEVLTATAAASIPLFQKGKAEYVAELTGAF